MHTGLAKFRCTLARKRHNEAVLRVEQLGKRYGDRWIFRGITFSLSPGDRLVVLGRNGSGKSTLLRTLGGLVPPSQGSIDYGTDDLRLHLGLSALDQALYPTLTVEEHFRLAADLRGCPDRTDELLEMIGLSAARTVPGRELSTGMRARVRMALAIQARPAVLLLDEPGASLDEAGRQLVEAVVTEQAERGCVVLATNEPQERRLATLELELVA